MRILIVEDDERIAVPVAGDLRRQHYAVDVASDGDTGLAFARSGVYDVVLLDVMLPGRSGLEICRELRSARCDAMILILTGRDATHDKVAGLDAGADDYLVKPFELAELSARLRALARRHAQTREPVLRAGALNLDSAARLVRYDAAPVALTPTEFAILEALMHDPARVFSRSMLIERIAPFERDVGEQSIKSHVANVRRKIRRAGCPYDPLETVYGNGYRLRDAP